MDFFRYRLIKVPSVGLSFLLFFYPFFPASGQFLRLGPFDFFAKTRLEGIYTTNVEQERPSEQTAEAEDYYLVWALDLSSAAYMNPRTALDVSTGIALEKHFNRPDLDNSEAPFGYFRANFITDFQPLTISGGFRFERTSDSIDDKFVPVGQPSRKSRQVGNEWEAEIGADWVQRYYGFGASYTYSEQRYDKDIFSEDETDEHNLNYYLELKPFTFASVRYEMDKTKTIYINKPGEEAEWDGQEKITVDLNLNQGLFDRPQITYSIGVQNEYETDGTEKGWELTHTITIRDTYELSPSFNWSYFFTYDYEQKPDDDDISVEYGLMVNHTLTDYINHTFMARQSPVETLGSTDDTKETEYVYTLRFVDILISGLSAYGSAGYTISEPLNDEAERTITYLVGAAHNAQLNPRLSRKLAYDYSRESSNLEPEVLEEHRVTLSFVFDL